MSSSAESSTDGGNRHTHKKGSFVSNMQARVSLYKERCQNIHSQMKQLSKRKGVTSVFLAALIREEGDESSPTFYGAGALSSIATWKDMREKVTGVEYEKTLEDIAGLVPRSKGADSGAHRKRGGVKTVTKKIRDVLKNLHSETHAVFVFISADVTGSWTSLSSEELKDIPISDDVQKAIRKLAEGDDEKEERRRAAQQFAPANDQAPIKPSRKQKGGRDASGDAGNKDKKDAKSGSKGRRGRKPYFPEHLPERELLAGIRSGKFVKGTIRINAKNHREAFVTVKGFERDIYLDGHVERNRALEGDTVVLQLKPKSEWAPVGEKKNGGSKGEESAKAEAPISQAAGLDALADQLASTSISQDNKGEEESGGKKVQLQPRGCVIGVLEVRHSKTQLGHFRNYNPDHKFHEFIPNDHRYPIIRVASRKIDSSLTKEDLEGGKLLSVRIDKWDHLTPQALGSIHKCIGSAGSIEAETEALLLQHHVDWSDFTEDVIDDLPKFEGTWTIPPEEFKNPFRQDFRAKRIFSIDPATARDLDDALSCIPLPNGNYEIGVHIADVSYFVLPNTSLDDVAADRCTSTYLTQKVIPMLPNLLSQDLCSLNPGVERLSFSAVFEMTPDAVVVNESFTRSIIKSTCKLSYDMAQDMLDGKYDARVARGDPCEDFETVGHHYKDVVSDVKLLNKLARKMRKRRFDNGAVSLNKVKLSFILDPETGDPVDVFEYPKKASNELIEEFMLLANMRVAERIATFYPDRALLRAHDPPLGRKMAEMQAQLAVLGYHIDIGSSKGLMKSMARESGSAHGMEFNLDVYTVLQLLATRPMKTAKYFCTGDTEDESEWLHFALQAKHYTHFTSPIRRYADVIVHRLLDRSIRQEAADKLLQSDPKREAILSTMTETPGPGRCADITERCNVKKMNAKKAQEDSSHVYLCLLLKPEPVVEEALIFDVWSGGIAILITKYGIEWRIRKDDFHASAMEYDESTYSVYVRGVADPTGAGGKQKYDVRFRPFQRIKVRLGVKPNKFPMDFEVSVVDFMRELVPTEQLAGGKGKGQAKAKGKGKE